MKNNNKINEIKKEMENLKNDFEKNYSKLELKLKKLEKRVYEIGDTVSYCNKEWYVIDVYDNKIRLMLKKTAFNSSYSDNNSNDWKESNLIDKIQQWGNSNLHVYDLLEMTTNYDEDKFSDDFIRIPTLREIEKLPMNIRNCGNYYWTMTSSYGVSEDCSSAYVFYVYDNGELNNYSVSWTTPGVRPVITLSTEKLN